MQNRTDLALESYESKDKTAIDGVVVREKNGVTTVEVRNEHGAKALGKPVGSYITLKMPSFVNDTDIFDGRLNRFADALRTMLPPEPASVLVAGLGNKNITADALGPITNRYVLATRHIVEELCSHAGFEGLRCVSAVTTGVLGDTGIESAEIIKGIVQQIRPSCVITVDALAASSMERLGTTVQLSSSGISPGSGVGNHRHEISLATVGVPVVAVGIPTVVSTAVLTDKTKAEEAFVTPREIDRITEQGAKLIGMGINVCLHRNISGEDLYALVG
ncbi:MAG: GPR endopeptidase [Eubacterium sp.]|nr:GPR endopeptidase [Eubacterium sp.]